MVSESVAVAVATAVAVAAAQARFCEVLPLRFFRLKQAFIIHVLGRKRGFSKQGGTV